MFTVTDSVMVKIYTAERLAVKIASLYMDHNVCIAVSATHEFGINYPLGMSEGKSLDT